LPEILFKISDFFVFLLVSLSLQTQQASARLHSLLWTHIAASQAQTYKLPQSIN